MKISKYTIKELGIILEEDYKLQLNNQDLEKLANSLVGYFDTLLKIEQRGGVRKSSTNPD